MDFYGTAATAIDQAIKVTIFIKGVISDIKSYEEDRAKFQLKLDLQLTSLEFFRRRFLDDKHGLLLPGQLPEWVADTICRLLTSMAKGLAEYNAIVAEYESLDSQDKEDVDDREKWKQSFFERAKAKAKSLKLKGYNWSLFDKKKLTLVLEDYKELTDSLRDLMQHFSQESIYNLADAVSSMKDLSLDGTGLEPVVMRQKLASSSAPETFQPLEGEIAEEGEPSNRFQLAKWTHNGESEEVIVEYHEYDRRLRFGDLEPDEIAELKAPLRNLAWLLRNSAFNQGDAEDPTLAQQPTIYSLQCLGYLDQAEKERFVFLYKIPFAGKTVSTDANHLVTLHELINKVDNQLKRPLKPALSERFRIAHCLALTLLNVHGSLWVHKNIWSRGIVLFRKHEDRVVPLVDLGSTKPGETNGNPSGSREQILAFLGDWGYARPVEGATEMRSNFDIEPNFYRHPDRQGYPTRQFGRLHDIYALGVVLLEIGLWRTISQLFDARIKEGQRTGKLPKPKDVRTVLLTLAQRDVAKEMGERYAAAVVSCLSGDLRSSSDTELTFDFKEKVIDAITPGMKL
ncbi:hypothetical protein VTO42DRAFT_5965 [Malbranchea cinnamomea]